MFLPMLRYAKEGLSAQEDLQLNMESVNVQQDITVLLQETQEFLDLPELSVQREETSFQLSALRELSTIIMDSLTVLLDQ